MHSMFRKLTLCNWLTLFTSLLLANVSVAHNHKDNAEHAMHNNHKAAHQTAVGIHGMAVIQVDGTYYASHMPLANSMHAHQVIFSFRLSKDQQAKVNTLSKQSALVTLMPERFDLMKLISGELTEFSGTLFKGHFERGGQAAIKSVTVTVEKMMLTTSLAANKNGNYYLLPVSENKGLLVHNIGSGKSFDQILSATFKTAQPIKGNISELIVGNSEPLDGNSLVEKPLPVKNSENTAVNILTAQSLYLETQDFQ